MDTGRIKSIKFLWKFKKWYGKGKIKCTLRISLKETEQEKITIYDINYENKYCLVIWFWKLINNKEFLVFLW